MLLKQALTKKFVVFLTGVIRCYDAHYICYVRAIVENKTNLSSFGSNNRSCRVVVARGNQIWMPEALWWRLLEASYPPNPCPNDKCIFAEQMHSNVDLYWAQTLCVVSCFDAESHKHIRHEPVLNQRTIVKLWFNVVSFLLIYFCFLGKFQPQVISGPGH